MPLTIERLATGDLRHHPFDQVLALCNEAYGADMAAYFDDIGPGVHLLGWDAGVLASHAMWVSRTLYPGGLPPLRCAYVELVATRVDLQRRGLATMLMRHLATEIEQYELGALSPAATSLYERLGWEWWRGPLFVRTDEGMIPVPEEEAMILRLPGSPEVDVTESLAVDWRPGEVW